jgi:hypothetical protein
MGRYLDALRNFRTPHHANQKNLINPTQEGYLGLLGSPPPPLTNQWVLSRAGGWFTFEIERLQKSAATR